MASILSRAEFLVRFGGVYEHSPWIAESAWDTAVDTQRLTSPATLAAAMAGVVDSAAEADQLALIRAHPDLAGKLAVAGELTAESTSEQNSAGLDQCSVEELEQFQTLNTRYVEKFAFPFVMAVRGSHRSDILSAFARRLQNSYAEEFATAITEIHKIAHLRIEAQWDTAGLRTTTQ